MGCETGHYESWFVRANHPRRPLAFWIRYTVLSPRRRAAEALGEVWAVWFDGEAGTATVVKEEFPLPSCAIAGDPLAVRIGDCRLSSEAAVGRARTGERELAWDLVCDGGEAPLLLLPPPLYERGFPRAKALVSRPNAAFDGTLRVGDAVHAIERWRGSSNHNWGSRHTDSYAWGQVAGFDGEPDAFLECSTAQLRLGPLWTPPLSLLVLRVGGREFALNSLRQAWKARGRFDFFDWRIDSQSPRARVAVHVHAPRSAFAALTYGNPPGGTKTCLNTKIASCEVEVHEEGKPPLQLAATRRAAFEILTDRDDHGVRIDV